MNRGTNRGQIGGTGYRGTFGIFLNAGKLVRTLDVSRLYAKSIFIVRGLCEETGRAGNVKRGMVHWQGCAMEPPRPAFIKKTGRSDLTRRSSRRRFPQIYNLQFSSSLGVRFFIEQAFQLLDFRNGFLKIFVLPNKSVF